MRAALPPEITMSRHVWNCSQAGALVASVPSLDCGRHCRQIRSWSLGSRAPLIPGMNVVKKAAVEVHDQRGWAGPTAVAVTDCKERGREIGERMVEAFFREGS